MPYRDKKKQYERQEQHRAINKANLLDYLVTHPCVDCSESNPVVLEFDHVRGEKKFIISKAVSGSTRSWKLIKEEIDKCDVRCANCHRIRTAQVDGFWKTMSVRG